MAVTYAFQKQADGTSASVRVQGHASGFFRLATPLLNLMVKRNLSADLRRLKKLLEAC